MNFHPRDLFKYRGCCALEWQNFRRESNLCTCHLIDEGVDTGSVYRKTVLKVSRDNYFKMRSEIYPTIATCLLDVIKTSLKILLNIVFFKMNEMLRLENILVMIKFSISFKICR